MAGLIKKQLLKHLSKFAKNLSADSIHLSTLKGEGELNNLELNCIALQDLLDLPTWLQINHAKCNRVLVKIPWTKLKTTAITLYLDCVELEMVTCEKPRPPNGPSPIEASASNGDSSYGFIEKVLEGIAVRINSINVNFVSQVFKAEFQLSQLLVYSTDPEGKKADLRFTRILNSALGQVLTFKKISWQTMRMVIDAASARNGGANTPIRLITSQGIVQIVLRRKVSNLAVIASKLSLKFVDLLWVLSDAQVQSALLCVKSIKETIERSKQQSRNIADSQVNTKQTPSVPAALPEDSSNKSVDPYFMRHMIHETSYHCDVDRIDFHICDDGSSNEEATYKKVVDGGAILITLHRFSMDHYPSHKAGSSRAYFRDYNDIAKARDKWADEIIAQFKKDFIALKKAATALNPQSNKSSAKLLESCLVFRLGDIEVGQVSSANDRERSNQKVLSSGREELHLPDDMPLGMVLLTDYYYPDGRDYPAPPNNVYVKVNAIILRAHWPSLLWLNQLSLATVRSVQNMLQDLGIVVGTKDLKEEEHTDIRIEALMPKIFIPLLDANPDPNMPEGIEINVSQATVTNCRLGENSSRDSLKELLELINTSYICKNSSFPRDDGYDFDFIHKLFKDHVNDVDSSLKKSLSEKAPSLSRASLLAKASGDVWSVWVRQVWFDFHMKGDGPNSKGRSVPFIDSTPMMLWIGKTESAFSPRIAPPGNNIDCATPTSSVSSSSIHQPSANDGTSSEEFESAVEENREKRNKALLDFYRQNAEDRKPTPKIVQQISGPASNYILIHSKKAIGLKVNHYEFLFLQRLMESIGNIGEKVVSDTTNILPTDQRVDHSSTDSTAVRLILPSVKLCLVLRPSKPNQPTVNDIANLMAAADAKPLSPSGPMRYLPQLLSEAAVLRPPSPCSSVSTVSILGEELSTVSVTPIATPSASKNEESRASSPGTPLRPRSPAQCHKKGMDSKVDGKSSASLQPLHESSSDAQAVSSTFPLLGSSESGSSISDDASSLERFVILEVDDTGVADDIASTPKLPVQPEVTQKPSSVVEKSDNEVEPMETSNSQMTVKPERDVWKAEMEERLDNKKKMQDQVSLVSITASGGIEVAVDSHGDNSSIRIIAPLASIKQMGDMTLDSAINEFLDRGSTSSPDSPPSSTPCLRMRIDSGACASRFHPGSDTNMQIQVEHFKETLLATTLTNLGIFMEDEKEPEIFPMKIDARDIALTIENDEDPIYPTSVRLPPVVLKVHEAHVSRDTTGAFHISTETSPAPDLVTSLHFANPTPPVNQAPKPTQTAVAINDNGPDVTSLEASLAEMTHQRNQLVAALDTLQMELEVSEKERVRLKNLLQKD